MKTSDEGRPSKAGARSARPARASGNARREQGAARPKAPRGKTGEAPYRGRSKERDGDAGEGRKFTRGPAKGAKFDRGERSGSRTRAGAEGREHAPRERAAFEAPEIDNPEENRGNRFELNEGAQQRAERDSDLRRGGNARQGSKFGRGSRFERGDRNAGRGDRQGRGFRERPQGSGDRPYRPRSEEGRSDPRSGGGFRGRPSNERGFRRDDREGGEYRERRPQGTGPGREGDRFQRGAARSERDQRPFGPRDGQDRPRRFDREPRQGRESRNDRGFEKRPRGDDDSRFEKGGDRRPPRSDETRTAPSIDRATEQYYFGANACRAIFDVRPEDIIRAHISHRVRPEAQYLIAWCSQEHKPFHLVDDEDLKRLSDGVHHEGICILAKRRGMKGEEELEAHLAAITADEKGCWLVLDGVKNPHNLGAILRVAGHFGLRGIVGSADLPGLSAATCRVAQGAAEHVPVFHVGDVSSAISLLKEKGITIIGTAPQAKASIFSEALEGRCAFVLGSEDEGVSEDIAKKLDRRVSIPGAGLVQSLNVAHAAAICAAEHWRATHAG